MSDEILKEVEDLRSLDERHIKMPNEFVDFPNNSVLYSESWCAAHIEQVMNWAFARKPPAKLVDVVTQDEFTHDVVLQVDEGVFLNFDTT